MAVPKQRQSHARTNKRRSQHKIDPAGADELPEVPRAEAAAPRLPECGTYAGREVVVRRPDADDDDE